MAGRRIDFQAVMDIADARRKLRRLEKETSTTGDKMSKMAGNAKKAFKLLALGGVAVAGAALFNHGVKVEALERRYETVFKGVTAGLDQWIDHQNERFGVSEAQLKGMAASIGDLLVPLGITREEAAGTSKEVLILANALSEWTGGQRSTTEVTEILTKAMLGERDALIALGVKLSEEEIQAELTKQGVEDLTGAELQRAKALVTMTLIQERSTDALTAYEDGSNDAQAAQKEMAAALDEAKEAAADLVVKLTPLVKLMTGLVNLLDGIETVDQIERMIPIVEELEERFGGAEEAIRAFKDAEDDVQRSEVIAHYQELLRNVNELTAAIDAGNDQPLITEEAVAATRTAAEELALILAGIAEDAPAQFRLKVDGIVETWEGLPDALKGTEFDVQKAIRNVLAVSAAETKFAEDLETLVEAGLDGVVTALVSSPNRADAMAAAEALAEDLAGAAALEEAMEGTTSAERQAFLDKLERLRADPTIISAAGRAGGEHARAYQEGWDVRMGDWTPSTPLDDGFLDDIEEGLTRRQSDGGAVLQ